MSAATVVISESNGAGETVTDNISLLNFGRADLPNLNPSLHPLIIPTSGNAFAYGKMLRVKVVNIGTSAFINNLRLWRAAGSQGNTDSIKGWAQLGGFTAPTGSSVYWNYAVPANEIGGGPDGTTDMRDWNNFLNTHNFGISATTPSPNISVGGVPNDATKHLDGTAGKIYSDYCFLTQTYASTQPVGSSALASSGCGTTKTIRFSYEES